MKPADHYKGREQTYLKHYVLEQYLETVTFHIGYAQNEFVYVDCFSGPWHHESDDLADTSIRIALGKLNFVRDALASQKRYPTIRAIFIEKDADSFVALQRTLETHRGSVHTTALTGTFEDNVSEILKEVGAKFAFCFIDPTGWKGLGMDHISPRLRHRPGEVLINFMYDFINRFVNSHDPATEASLDRFFGTERWRDVRDHADREAVVVNLYAERVRAVGAFPYVTSTRILKPLHQRTYFHLIYATRSSKGIEKFREVEKRLVPEQERVRGAAQREHRKQRTGQDEFLFDDSSAPSPSVEDERATQYQTAKTSLFELLQHRPRKYEELLPLLLQLRLFCKTDFHRLLREEREHILIKGMAQGQRVPREGCIIQLR
jgi:three-Cys-motif partner protein